MIVNGILISESDDGYSLVVNYDESLHLYSVNVIKDGQTKSVAVNATYEPLFGVDILDQNAIYEAAEKLIEEF